jgi:hypothetical protein
VLRLAQRKPADGSTHWSTRKIAAEVGTNHVRVTRILAKAGLQPHRLRRYVSSNDPEFEEKATDIIGLYLKPPVNAAVFCVDSEKCHSSIGRTWGYHTLGVGAGVDFPQLLFADQVGEAVPMCRGRTGVRWVRLVTDLPTGILEILRGRQNAMDYLTSLTESNVESVFSRDDPFPGLAEVALLPYLTVKRGF